MALATISACAIVVAHPDDEALFFGGVVARRRDVDWHVVCVTDGAGGGDPALRSRELREACRRLGVARVSELKLPDQSRRPLPVDALVPRLAETVTESVVLTHGAHDVHPHHRQVLFACCLAFGSERVSMFAPRAALHPAQLRAKRSLLEASYPSQFKTEELLRRYLWWLEGAEYPSFAVLGSVPLDSHLLPESVWNIALTAELVTHPLRVLAGVDTGCLAARAGGGEIAAARGDNRARAVDFLTHTAAEAEMRAGKAHHMAWFTGLRAIADHLSRQGRLQLFGAEDARRASLWMASGPGLHRVAASDGGTKESRINDLAGIARAAVRDGFETLWLPPDDPTIAPLEALDPALVQLDAPRRAPAASAASLWECPE